MVNASGGGGVFLAPGSAHLVIRRDWIASTTPSEDGGTAVYTITAEEGAAGVFVALGSEPAGRPAEPSSRSVSPTQTADRTCTWPRLLVVAGFSWLPAPSPPGSDGTQIAFTTPSEDGGTALYTIRGRGGAAGCSSPWARNRLVARRSPARVQCAQRKRRIGRVGGHASGGGGVFVAPGSEPAWSSDGTQIAFTTPSEDGDTAAADRGQEGAAGVFVALGSEPAWSPDGSSSRSMCPTQTAERTCSWPRLLVVAGLSSLPAPSPSGRQTGLGSL